VLIGCGLAGDSSYRLVYRRTEGNLSLAVPLAGALGFWLLGAIVTVLGVLYN
jgi:hypothetical protein